MQIVIDIPENYYKECIDVVKNKDVTPFYITEWIANGIPLPKGHGRLIDIDTNESYMAMRAYVSGSDIGDMIDEMSMILEADNGGDINEN